MYHQVNPKFTCFTSTKVQRLTLMRLSGQVVGSYHSVSVWSWSGRYESSVSVPRLKSEPSVPKDDDLGHGLKSPGQNPEIDESVLSSA